VARLASALELPEQAGSLAHPTHPAVVAPEVED
jgi:hypothetical protein